LVEKWTRDWKVAGDEYIFSTKIKFATGVMHRLIICISALMPVYSAFDVISMLIKK